MQSKKQLIALYFLQCYEIKILNSKMYDEQLNLTKPYTKNKSFETTKNLKNLNFKKNQE